MAHWRKIDTRVWNDEKFCSFSDRGKLLFLYILTHPSMTALGAMRHTVAGLVAEIGWNVATTHEVIQEMTRGDGPVIVDEQAHFIGLRNWFKYNKPDHPNGIEALWTDALDTIPECHAKHELILRAAQCLDGLSPQMRRAIRGDAWRAAMEVGEPGGNHLLVDQRIWDNPDFQRVWSKRLPSPIRIPDFGVDHTKYSERELGSRSLRQRSVRLNKRGFINIVAAYVEWRYRMPFECLGCGVRDVQLHPDHIVPLCWGGTNEIANFQLFCTRCNSDKSGQLPSPPRMPTNA